jgi:flotillin
MWYHVAEPSAYLAVTGVGIRSVHVAKKAFVYPGQKVCKFFIMPFDYSLSLQALSIEKLNFTLPAVFTIGPKDDPASLQRYAVLLTGDGVVGIKDKGETASGKDHVQRIIKGIIQGETRSIVSTMTMEELFKERKIFRKKVIEGVQSELDQFGLCIYNANVKELQDTPGSEYFSHLSRKAHEGALNQARVDVAEARMMGEIGESRRQGQARQEIAKIHADTAVKETERKAEKAQADAALTDKEISIEKSLNLARIEAKRAAETRDTELQKTLETKRAEMELEKQRATEVTKAVIQRESEQQKADATLYTKTRNAEALKTSQNAEADAAFYRTQKDVEARFFQVQQDSLADVEKQKRAADAALYRQKRDAEAAFFKVQQESLAKLEKAKREAEATVMEADARLHVQKQEALGMMEMARAYGAMAQVLGGPDNLIKWQMLNMGTYEKLAHHNALAIQGLQPKINVWNTGSNAESMDPTAPIRNLFQALPPLLTTIQDQTGMGPPSWLAQMTQLPKQDEITSKELKPRASINGLLSAQ